MVTVIKAKWERTNPRNRSMATPCRSDIQQRGMRPISFDCCEPRDAASLSSSAFQVAHNSDRRSHLRQDPSAHPLAERRPVVLVRPRFAHCRPGRLCRWHLPVGERARKHGSRDNRHRKGVSHGAHLKLRHFGNVDCDAAPLRGSPSSRALSGMRKQY
jgi:hypothetical protein